MKRALTIIERAEFLHIFVDNVLTEEGQKRFFRSFYWSVIYKEGRKVGHDILDSMEAYLYNLLSVSECRRN